MKEVNLISLISAFRHTSTDSFESYKIYHSINIKDSEIRDLNTLVINLKLISKNIAMFDKFFIGYSIPQIGKEFDLLRIDKDTIVNIELKKKSTREKITTQLVRNKYYLSFLNRNLLCFTYVADENKLFTLDKTDTIEEVNLIKLIEALVSQEVEKKYNIDTYFNPTNYLVSPFNSTQEFVKGKYFLTLHQEQIKNEILNDLKYPHCSILSIKGNAGTGKTLLTYDIAKTVLTHKEILIVHCGYLNVGQNRLRDDYGWNIISAREITSQDLSKYHLIIVDEAQRIYPVQLNHLLEEVTRISTNIIFSYDGQQTLNKWEIENNVSALIESKITMPTFELTSKIRTNKEIISFIQCLFSNKRGLEKYRFENIEIYYFNDYLEAKGFLEYLTTEGCKVINYTPDSKASLPYDQYRVVSESDNAHTVIGQEFNNVVAVIDEHFYYKKSGELSTNKYKYRPYYHPTKMLYQIVTRARMKLVVVIIRNQEILNRCLDILNNK